MPGTCASCVSFVSRTMDHRVGVCARYPPMMLNEPLAIVGAGSILPEKRWPMVLSVETCGEYRSSSSQPPPPSTDGEIFFGNGPPNDLTGMNGDHYLDMLNGDLYEKQNGTWS